MNSSEVPTRFDDDFRSSCLFDPNLCPCLESLQLPELPNLPSWDFPTTTEGDTPTATGTTTIHPGNTTTLWTPGNETTTLGPFEGPYLALIIIACACFLLFICVCGAVAYRYYKRRQSRSLSVSPSPLEGVQNPTFDETDCKNNGNIKGDNFVEIYPDKGTGGNGQNNNTSNVMPIAKGDVLTEPPGEKPPDISPVEDPAVGSDAAGEKVSNQNDTKDS